LIASEVEVRCGYDSFMWECFPKLFNQLLRRNSDPTRRYQGGYTEVGWDEETALTQAILGSVPAQFCRDNRRSGGNVRETSTWPLLRLCSEYGEAHCEDERDKILSFIVWRQNVAAWLWMLTILRQFASIMIVFFGITCGNISTFHPGMRPRESSRSSTGTLILG
jgi:hypothetical protein